MTFIATVHTVNHVILKKVALFLLIYLIILLLRITLSLIKFLYSLLLLTSYFNVLFILCNLASKTMQLDKEANHYAIPCMDILEKYLEILECQEIKGLIILQSLLSKVCNFPFYFKRLNL